MKRKIVLFMAIILTAIIVLTTIIILTGYGKKEENDNIQGRDESKTSQVTKDYYYKSLDVSEFDVSKFDGVIKLDVDNNATLKAPFTYNDIINLGYELCIPHGHEVGTNIFKTDRINKAPDSDKYLSSNNYDELSIKIPNSTSNYPYTFLEIGFDRLDMPIKDILEKNLYNLSDSSSGSKYINNFINIHTTDNKFLNDSYKQIEILIDTIGQPSKIIIPYPEQEQWYRLVYEYVDYTLEFVFMELDPKEGLNVRNFNTFAYYTKEAWTSELQGYRTDEAIIIE